jgi:hypothetical protein
MLHRGLSALELDGLTWADLRYDLGAGLLLTALLVPAGMGCATRFAATATSRVAARRTRPRPRPQGRRSLR